MKITAIANISANGKVLLAENPNHQAPKAGEEFFIQKVVQAGNIILGRKTFEVIEQLAGGEANIKHIFPDVEIVVLSSSNKASGEYKVAQHIDEAIRYLEDKGFTEIIVGGGTNIYNSFLEKNLITDAYFNIVPVITGGGGVIGMHDQLFNTYQLTEHQLLDGGIVQLHLTRSN
jgi:dihydrofolate reductase